MKLEFFSINRTALVIRPTAEMIKWVNSVFPEDPITYKPKAEHDDFDIFLLPDFDSPEDAIKWLKKNYLPFLRYALNDWCTDEATWPQPLNWELFEKFLEYSLQTVVVDTMDEEYDEDFDEDFDLDFDDDFEED